jgi:RNA-binding motif protein, X-linked 2
LVQALHHGTTITRVRLTSSFDRKHDLTINYTDSAYVHVGGLDYELTEGDVIVIFSQCVKTFYENDDCLEACARFGEVMDVNMPRDKSTGKPKGFAFLMYEDQRSTVLAVDNLNGAQVRGRTLKVDHVKNYKQPKAKGEDGEFVEREEQSLNAKPELIYGALSLALLSNTNIYIYNR